jgi:hypothetical protein
MARFLNRKYAALTRSAVAVVVKFAADCSSLITWRRWLVGQSGRCWPRLSRARISPSTDDDNNNNGYNNYNKCEPGH